MTGLAINRTSVGNSEIVSQRRNPRILFASLATAGALTLGGCSIQRERSCDFHLETGQTHFERNFARTPEIQETHFRFIVDVDSVTINGRSCRVSARASASYSDSARFTVNCGSATTLSLISTSVTFRPQVIPNAQGNGSHVVLHATYRGTE